MPLGRLLGGLLRSRPQGVKNKTKQTNWEPATTEAFKRVSRWRKCCSGFRLQGWVNAGCNGACMGYGPDSCDTDSFELLPEVHTYQERPLLVDIRAQKECGSKVMHCSLTKRLIV